SISFVTVLTTRTSVAFPAAAPSRSSLLRTTNTSRHAAHSRAEPRAISRNRTRSGTERLPLPSAMHLVDLHVIARREMHSPLRRIQSRGDTHRAFRGRTCPWHRPALENVAGCRTEHEHEHEYEHDRRVTPK